MDSASRQPQRLCWRLFGVFNAASRAKTESRQDQHQRINRTSSRKSITTQFLNLRNSLQRTLRTLPLPQGDGDRTVKALEDEGHGSISKGAVLRNTVLLQCGECGSGRLRRSRLRLADVVWLIRMRYPVRCRKCVARAHMPILLGAETRQGPVSNEHVIERLGSIKEAFGFRLKQRCASGGLYQLRSIGPHIAHLTTHHPRAVISAAGVA